MSPAVEVMSACAWRGGLCMEVNPLPDSFIVFGAGGDLAKRKLFPALFQLHARGLLHDKTRIVACARRPYDDDAYREQLRAQLPASAVPAVREAFLNRVCYVSGDYADSAFYATLRTRLEAFERDAPDLAACRIFYLSTPPAVCPAIVERLHDSGLTADADAARARRVVIEKPFGSDAETAQALEQHLHRFLTEEQIYRIDHYLGKETVQNILMFRFANLIFEPVWNRQYIDSVQISVLESVGVEHRANYFDRAGLLRDMFQNHMLELLSLVAMEVPSSFEADAVRDEKLKLLRSLRPLEQSGLVRGQYAAGTLGGISVPAYRDEPGVAPGSSVETYVAARLAIDNWRWAGVPFYLRSGKRTAVKRSEIVIDFKPVPRSIFAPLQASDLTPNRLILAVQPEEGLTLSILAKQPGPKLCMGTLNMDFKYQSVLCPGEGMPDAYERLILDAMLGDQTLFIRGDTIALAWSLLTPILRTWEAGGPDAAQLSLYPAGSYGPDQADSLLFQDGRHFWRNPS